MLKLMTLPFPFLAVALASTVLLAAFAAPAMAQSSCAASYMIEGDAADKQVNEGDNFEYEFTFRATCVPAADFPSACISWSPSGIGDGTYGYGQGWSLGDWTGCRSGLHPDSQWDSGPGDVSGTSDWTMKYTVWGTTWDDNCNTVPTGWSGSATMRLDLKDNDGSTVRTTESFAIAKTDDDRRYWQMPCD